MAQYLTQQDVNDYGIDLVNFAQRAAADAVAPQIQFLDRQNQELQARLAHEARARMDMRVEQAIPDFRTIDQDPEWHRWLLTVDNLSGRVRQVLLDDAIASGDVNRVIAFFRGFQREAGTMRHASSVAYGRARSMPSGQIYTRSQITRLYDQHRRGAYNGRESEWARQEQDIIAAGREGRIRGGVDLHGK